MTMGNPEAELLASAGMRAAEDFANATGRVAASNQRMRTLLEALRRACRCRRHPPESCACASIEAALRTDDL